MEAKKYQRADINRYRFIFFNIGLIISLGLTYTAFEWKFYDDDGAINMTQISEDSFEEMVEIPPTEQPPPPPPKLQNVTIIEIEDVSEIEDQLEISFDIEMTEGMTIESLPEVVDVEEVEEEVTDEIFLIVEEKPLPEGGMSSFYSYVNSNLKYPSQARRMRIQGRVFIQFVIEKNGSISQVEVIRGIDSSCNQEAVRVISNAPAWLPGKQRGKPVRVKMVLPISFKLQ